MCYRDRQKYHPFDFVVPPGTQQLRICFNYTPGNIGDVHNLLTLTLFDPLGFRGAAHRWSIEQEILVTGARATPGFLPGPIPSGKWQVEIDAHEILNDGQAHGWCEFELSVVAQNAPSGEAFPVRPICKDPRKTPPQAACIRTKPGWYKGDLHSHNQHCDGSSPTLDMAAAAVGCGLDFLAVTCHNTTSWFGTTQSWPEGLLPVRGMECTTYYGHANVLGIEAWVDWRTAGCVFGTRTILKQAKQMNALFVINHPCAVGNPLCTGCHWSYLGVDFAQVDCLEIWNGTWDERGVYNPSALALWSELLNEGIHITAVAGTDNHAAHHYQSRKGLAFTWVYAEGLAEADILNALQQGRAFLSSGPELYFTATSSSGFKTSLPGTTMPVKEPVSITVKVGKLQNSATLWLVTDGCAEQSWHVSVPGTEVFIDAVSPKRWCRFELRNGNGVDGELLAITNPLYTERS